MGICFGYLRDILGISWGPLFHWSMVHWSIGPLDYWSIGSLVECQMLNVNKVKLLSERTSGVPPVIFTSGQGLIKGEAEQNLQG